MVTAQPSRSAPPKLVTADDLLRMSKDEFYGELIRGELCEVPPPGFLHEQLVAQLIFLLKSHVDAKQLGQIVGGSGVWTERDPDTVRAPDVQFYSSGRLPLGAAPRGYTTVAPNLAIEIRSPNDSRRDLHDKAIMWLNAGVEMVWVVLPERRTVDVYRSDLPVLTVSDEHLLDGLNVLPGFSCSLADFLGPADPDDAQAAR